MRRLLLFLIGLLTITGCVDSAHTVSVLNAVDSLIAEQPDSAYKLLQTLNGERIWQGENEAKYALLMTQAKYKTYVKNESDSLINIAVDYYRDSENPDMYARALFYLGTVNADMGDSDAAIENYKAADATGTTDTLLLGFINSNVGWLYSNEYGKDVTDIAINKLKQALIYFRVANSLKSVNYTAGRIGQIYRTEETQDSAQFYLNLACKLSAQRCDTSYLLANYAHLVTSYGLDNKVDLAKEIALSIIGTYPKCKIPQELYLSLSKLYAAQNRIDSAYYYLNETPIDSTNLHSYYLARTDIEKAAKDYKSAFNSYQKSTNLLDSIMRANNKFNIYEIEKRYDKKQLEVEHKHLRNLFNLWVVIAILFACVAFMICGAYMIYRRRRNRERQNYIETLKEQENAFVDTRANLDIMMNQCLELEKSARSNLEGRVALMGELIGEAYACGSRYDKFAERFNKLVIKKPLGVDSFADIHAMVNNNYGGIIDYLTTTYPALNSSEIDICALTCIGFTSQQLFILLCAPKIETIYYKKSIINDKIGAKGDLRKNLFDIIEKIDQK